MNSRSLFFSSKLCSMLFLNVHTERSSTTPRLCISATPLIFYEFSKFPSKMHYGYRKKRLLNFPLVHHAPIPKCFDCFMLTFTAPIWDKKFQIFRVALQTPFP